jgi:hypothetical protein
MRCSFRTWFVYLLLEVILLQGGDFLSPVASSPPSPPGQSSLFTPLDGNSNARLFTKIVSASQEFNLLRKQEHKQASVLVRFRDLSLPIELRDDRLRSVSTLSFSSLLFFFPPRKLAPPSADDEPFLS